MIYTTNNINNNTLRTDEITKRINDLKKPNQIEIVLPTEKDCNKKQVGHKGHHNKEKITCCFFFNKS